MLSLQIMVDEGVWGLKITARVWSVQDDGRRVLVGAQSYYPTLPDDVLDEDPLVAACVALRQWAVRTIGCPPNGPTAPDR